MMRVRDNQTGEIREAKAGESVLFPKSGRRYVFGKTGELLVERRQKKLSPGKQRRRERRAAALERLRKPVEVNQ